MATIAIFIDMEAGHMIPSFGLAQHLKSCGHRVCYLGPPNVECLARNQGFEFFSIIAEIPIKSIENQDCYDFINSHFSDLVEGKLLDGIIEELQPRVVLVLSGYYLVGLAIRYRYRIPIIYFIPILLRRYTGMQFCEYVINHMIGMKAGLAEFLDLLTQAGVRFRSFMDIAQLTLRIPKLVLFPEAFDLPGGEKDPEVYYIGAGIDTARSEQPFSWDGFDSRRPLIFCARGSQIYIKKEDHQRLFQTAIDAAALRPEWQFIIAISSAFKAEDFSSVPPNVTLLNWVPQLEVLSRSNAMINHGGFGTIKECIHMGVPMVILPLKDFRDHSDCADRVVHHGLGVRNDDPQVTAAQLILLLEQVLTDRSFNHCIGRMREKFKQQDRLELAAEVVERAIARSAERMIAEI